MDPLAGPFEIFELNPGESRTLHVLAAQQGTMEIHPAHTPQGKTINALRLVVDQKDKPTPPYYFDVTSQTLIPQLLPRVLLPMTQPLEVTITKIGSGAGARFKTAWSAPAPA